MEDLRPGDPLKVGPFRLAARLGSGGMGVVYFGADSTGRHAAVKVIHPELARNAEFRQRFAREARILGRINGACTARVLAADVDTDPPYLALEAVPGPNLADHVAEVGPLAPALLRPLAVGILEALTAIHAAGIVHRDLKPANVLLSPSGPMVIDFGIAHLVDATSLTRAGSVMGSPAWMAPEQFDDNSTTATDVFAWAATLVFAAAGQPPFGTGRVEAVYMRMMRGEPILPALPSEIESLIVQSLALDPAKRPSVAELLEALLGQMAVVDAAGATTQLLSRHWTLQLVPPLWPVLDGEGIVPQPRDFAATPAGIGRTLLPTATPTSRATSRRPLMVVGGVVAAALAAGAVLLSGVRPGAGDERQAEPVAAAETATTGPAVTDSPEPPVEQLGVQPDERERVTQIAEGLYGYRHDQLNAWRAGFSQHAAEPYLGEVQRTAADVVTPVAEQYKAVVVADVVDVGVLSRDDDSDTFLVFLNQSTTSTRVSGTQVDQSRLAITVDRESGRATQVSADGAFDAPPAVGALGALARAAETAVEPLMSLSAATFDADVDQVLARAAGTFEADFKSRVDDLRVTLEENDVRADSAEIEAAIITADADSFTALVQADSSVININEPKGRTNSYRIRADLIRDGETWKVETLEFIG